MAKLSLTELKECAKGLQKAIGDSNWRDVEAILKRLRDEAEPTEETIRSTKLGKTIGPLRKSDDAAVAELAKTIVKKWKDLVDAEKAAAAASGKKKDNNGTTSAPAAAAAGTATGESSRKGTVSIEGSASPASKGPGTPIASAASPKPEPSAGAGAGKSKLSNGSSAAAAGASSSSSLSDAPPRRRSSSSSKPLTSIDFECLHDKVRNACLKLLYQSLEVDLPAAPSGGYAGAEARAGAFDVALAVEGACYAQLGGGTETNAAYRAKVRSLALNLKDRANPALRASVRDGRTLPERLVVMRPEEMASDARREERQRLQVQNLFNAKAAEDQQAETDAFECARCKMRKCTYYQKQTRSADEPMTVFVTCTNCKYRWKFS